MKPWGLLNRASPHNCMPALNPLIQTCLDHWNMRVTPCMARLQSIESRLLLLGLMALVTLIMTSVAFWVGAKASTAFWLSIRNIDVPFISSSRLINVVGQDAKIKFLEHEIARVTHSEKIELAAVAEMKKAMREKDLELLKLTQELHFYRTLYSADTDNTAIQVKAFSLHKDLTENLFFYELVLTSVPKKQEKVSGVIGLSVDGEQQGISKRLVFADVSDITDASATFSFKYFQKISSAFSLPDNFSPSSVRVEILRNDNAGNKPVVVNYNWGEVYKDP